MKKLFSIVALFALMLVAANSVATANNSNGKTITENVINATDINDIPSEPGEPISVGSCPGGGWIRFGELYAAWCPEIGYATIKYKDKSIVLLF